MIGKTREDYLRAIYTLHERQGKVRSVDLAAELGISKPSVSEMLKKLAKEKLVKYEPYSPVVLTKKGLVEAREDAFNYRIIEVFLTKTLGYSPEKVYVEAHRLEHAFLPASIKRLDDFLGRPSACPHGSAIRRKNA